MSSRRTATESKARSLAVDQWFQFRNKLHSPIYLSIYLLTVLRIRLKVVLNNGHAKKE